MMFGKFVLLVAFCALPSLFASAKDLEKLAYSTQWLRMIHYKPNTWTSGFTSEADGPDFFLAADGKINPKAELVATIGAMTEPERKIGRLKQHPQCAFPYRLAFLREQIGLQVASMTCPELDAFLQRVEPASVTLVYSSAYASNPASMFGHTFLRINRQSTASHDVRRHLLDYGVNFAAQVVNDDNNFLFMWRGVFGGYEGHFGLDRYYRKLKEYRHLENRDLWEYELRLTTAQTRSLLLHLWELETNSHFDYFFFDENCSYQILKAIEVIDPGWQLDDFWFYVIPTETIKRLVRASGVRQVHFRPSIRKRLNRSYALLDGPQKQQFWQLVKATEPPVTNGSDLDVMDLSLRYLNYHREKKGGELTDVQKSQFRKLLIARSRIRGSSQVVARPQLDAWTQPESGHPPQSVSLATGQQRTDGFYEIGFRFAYHDLLNSDRGFQQFSQINFPNARVRVLDDGSSPVLSQLNLFSVASLIPVTGITGSYSWRFDLGYERDWLDPCRGQCSSFGAQAGLGAAVHTFGDDHVLYGMMLIHPRAVFDRGSTFSPGVGLELAAISNFWNRAKVMLRLQSVRYAGRRMTTVHRMVAALSGHISDRNDLRVSTTLYREGALSHQTSEQLVSWHHHF